MELAPRLAVAAESSRRSPMDATEPLVYVASEVEGEEWVEARVVSRSADGTVTLETLESKETRTQPADVSAAPA